MPECGASRAEQFPRDNSLQTIVCRTKTVDNIFRNARYAMITHAKQQEDRDMILREVLPSATVDIRKVLNTTKPIGTAKRERKRFGRDTLRLHTRADDKTDIQRMNKEYFINSTSSKHVGKPTLLLNNAFVSRIRTLLSRIGSNRKSLSS